MFDIHSVPSSSRELLEQLGTKAKFWYQHPNFGPSLFKLARPGTGEDWSEKIACEIASRLALPHASYELAECNSLPGVITPSFVPVQGRLVLGNELLGRFSRGYSEGVPKFRMRHHTVELVLHFFRLLIGLKVPIAWNSADHAVLTPLGVFVGYLMLDALICNQDRHHENWGIVVTREQAFHLAPTYDHASCLGRNESDKKRGLMLTTRDSGSSIDRYVSRSKSAFFQSPSSTKPLGTLEVFRLASEVDPFAAAYWLNRLRAIKLDDIDALINQVPDRRMSKAAKRFSFRMLELMHGQLLNTQNSNK